ncbi:MAG TPA: MazG nucleotide pyrophosphohydrolase domain-containing protein [Patescibacteria group bacterium]|nr:MazG nucleotide pyrophosphohydrolase domain-containing protein [Patescibacteria group bacterium]
MSDLYLRPHPTLHDLQVYVDDMIRERGFTDNIPQRFMLLLEEAGEFAKAARKRAGLKFAEDTHTAELDEEAADVLIILLGLCNQLDIDLEAAFRAKEERNKLRTWK